MRIDQTTAPAGKRRNPVEFDFPTGLYLCRMLEVEENPPPKESPDDAPRLVFSFEVADGPWAGKKATTFVYKKLTPKTQRSKASKLYELAKQFGVIDPMQGFDTTQFVGKFYQVMVTNERAYHPDGSPVNPAEEPGRAWANSVMPAAAPAPPAAGPKAPPPPPRRPAPPAAEPADDSRWMFHTGGKGADWEEVSAKEIRVWLNANPAVSGAAFVSPADGGGEAKPFEAYGFKPAVPF